MSDVYPPEPPAGVTPAMLPAPPAPKAEVAQLATTGGSHLTEIVSRETHHPHQHPEGDWEDDGPGCPYSGGS